MSQQRTAPEPPALLVLWRSLWRSLSSSCKGARQAVHNKGRCPHAAVHWQYMKPLEGMGINCLS